MGEDQGSPPDTNVDVSASLETPDTVVQPPVQTAPDGQATALDQPVELQADDTLAKPPGEAAATSAAKPQGRLRRRLHSMNAYSILFGVILLIAVGAAIYSLSRARQAARDSSLISDSLTPEELAALENSDTKIGDPQQTLSIESNTILNGSVLVRDNLDVAGALTVADALSLPGLSVSGVSNFDSVQVGNNIAVGGNVSAEGQLNINQSLSVGGTASFGGAITAPSITVNQLQLNQDLVLNRHIDTGGSLPSVSVGAGAGGGSTASISGNDIAGTVTINTGGSPSAGVLANVTFAASYKDVPHVVISPSSSAAGGVNFYVTRTRTGFSISSTNAASGSATLTFDYIVMD